MVIVMTSLKTCHEILNRNGKKYSETETKIIREELTKLSRVEYEFYKEVQRAKNKESLHLHESVHGGTGDAWIQSGVSRGAS